MNARATALPIRATTDTAIVSGMDVTVRLPIASPACHHDCLICSRPIGTSLANQLTIWPVMNRGCRCGNLCVMAFLVHASCPVPNATRVIELAVARIEIDHAAGDECS